MEAPPNYGPLYTAEFRQVYRDLAREHDGVIFVPFYLEGVAGNPGLNLSDGIHPNAAGSRIIEERLWRALEPVLEKHDQPVGFKAALELAAAEDCTTVSEWVRRTCMEKLKATILRDAEPANDDVAANRMQRRA